MSQSIKFKNLIPHLIAVIIFLIINLIMYAPLFFEGKNLNQNDILQGAGANQEIVEYRDQTGEEALWTNGMFSGMPAYLINVQWSGELTKYVQQIVSLNLPSPASHTFIAMLAFYILLLAFGVNPYLAIAGGLTYGLNTFFMISVEAGHIWKVAAISWMPGVLAGIVLTFKKKYLLGFVLTALAMALEIRSNHYQITYYLMLIVVIYGIFKLVEAIQQKTLLHFAKTLGILSIAVLLGIGANLGKIWSAYEYGKYSIRGASELSSNTQSTSGGLDRDYAFAWSNGVWEPLTFLVPNFYGGATQEEVDLNSSLANGLKSRGAAQGQIRSFVKSVPTYWGDQPFTSGPYYLGAVAIFLFFIGAFLIKGAIKWWLVAASIFGIVLSWGDNFEFFNYLVFDYLPGYNKFRSVSMTVAIPFLCMPLLGFIGLQQLLDTGFKANKKDFFKGAMTIGAILILLFLATYILRFRGAVDDKLGDQAWLIELIRDQRASMARADVLRSILMVGIAFSIIWLWSKEKIKSTLTITLIAVLLLIDYIPVSKRYLNEENFVKNPKKAFFNKSEADKRIDQDESHYRVLNLNNPFNEARTSYYHSSIGGYHGAKMRRYADVIDYHLQKEMGTMVEELRAGKTDLSEFQVLNMLNTKYIKFGEQAGQVIQNNAHNGNAWFVSNVLATSTADESIESLNEVNTKETAVINTEKFSEVTTNSLTKGAIELTEYGPNHLVYKSDNSGAGLAVFSEIYYPKGWTATIDGKTTPIIQADYILRAINVPAGSHTITFDFKPDAYFIGNKIMWISSIILLVLAAGGIVYGVIRKN